MLSLTIGGVSYSAMGGTLNINDNINARSTASFSIMTGDSIQAGQEVLIYDDATLIFGGTIETYRLTYLQGGTETSRRKWDISCVDFNQIGDRRRVAASYVGQSVTTIVTDIVTNFMAGEGITVGTITEGSTIIEQAVFNYLTVTEALDYIRDVTALNWNIGYNKVLTLFKREDNLDLEINDGNCFTITLEETRHDYRNEQLIRAGDSTTEVQVDEVPSPKPDGESKVFTVRFPLATKPGIKINSVSVPSGDIGILGLDVNKEWYWQKGSKNITQDLTDTNLTSSDTIEISYQGLKPIIVRADNPAAQNSRALIEGGTGIYTEIESQPSIDTKTGALEFANGLLQKYGEIPRKVSVTLDSKRTAGTIVQVQSDNLGINEDFLVTNVSIYDFDGCGTLRYNVTGDSGEDVGTWIDFFRNLKPKDLIIRDNEVLVLLQVITETSGWTGTTNIKVSDALYPSNSLYPSNTLYPNGNLQEEYNVFD